MNIWETDTFLAKWLNDELTAEEKAAFEKSEEFKHFKQIKDTLGQLDSPDYDQEAAMNQALERIQPKAGRTFSLKQFLTYAVAASVVVFACLAVYFTLLNDSIVEITASTQEKIELPSGSSLVLSKGSFVQYNESDWEDKRTIELKGEAFFQVEKGSDFEVQLAKGKINVLGTSFNILETDSAIEVICYSGKVRVEAYGQQQILEAGQAVEMKNGMALVNSIHLNAPVWIDRVASYKNVALSLVLQELHQWYDFKLIGEVHAELHFTGQFPTDDIEVALEQLFGPYKIKYKYNKERKELQLLNNEFEP